MTINRNNLILHKFQNFNYTYLDNDAFNLLTTVKIHPTKW